MEQQEEKEEVGKRWSFSTKLVITLIFNAVVGSFWVSKLMNRVDRNTENIGTLAARVVLLEQDNKTLPANLNAQMAILNTRITVLESRVQTLEQHK